MGTGRFAWLLLAPLVIVVAGCACNFFGSPMNFATPALPTDIPSSTPTLQPQPTATSTSAPRPSVTGRPTASAAPATATPTNSPRPAASLPANAELESVCIFIHHDQLGEFVSYLDFAMWWAGVDFFFLELTIKEANNDAPIQLVFDPEDGSWRGKFGLNGPGTKQIVSLVAHFPDGSQLDLTRELIDHLGSDEFEVRHPQEDVLGC